MSVLDYIRKRINRGITTFVNIVTLANRDYPFHDYMSDTTTSTKQTYQVGEKNVERYGDIKKRFVSKSTLIFCTTDTYIILNSAENVVQTILANTWYEFMSNIHRIHYYYVSTEGTIYIYCEGVLPQEGRGAE